MKADIQQALNTLPDKRVANALVQAFSKAFPDGTDTAITAYATGGQTNARRLKKDAAFHEVTTVATAADSVMLPPALPGEFHFVKNSAAANAMQVFGAGTDTIDSVATGTGVSQLAGDGVLYICLIRGNYIRLGGVSASEVFTTLVATTISMADGGYVDFSNASVAAAGSGQSTYTVIADQINAVTGADGTKGVALPAASAGRAILVINTDQTNTLKIAPVNGGNDAINSLTSGTGVFTMGPARAAWFVPTSGTQWYVTGDAAVVTTPTEANFNNTASAGTAVASKTAVLGANKELDEFHTAALYLGAGAGTLVGSTAAQIDAAVAGTPLVYRTNVTAAQVNAGATAVVPAVAGKRFQVIHISMAAAGGNVSGPTTVEVVEETAGTVFLSHITADLTEGVWHNHITGTPVITGITAGGMTSADNKALIVTKSGGTDFATATGLDVIVMGYYTTT